MDNTSDNQPPAHEFMLDSGAMINIMPVEALKKVGYDFKFLEETNIILTSYTDNNLPIIGKCNL